MQRCRLIVVLVSESSSFDQALLDAIQTTREASLLDLNSKPKTRNPKPETRNPKPEIRNPKP